MALDATGAGLRANASSTGGEGRDTGGGDRGGEGNAAAQSRSEPGDRDDDHDNRLDDAAQALIGQQLKAVYGEIVQQPVPDKLLELLEELERKERAE